MEPGLPLGAAAEALAVVFVLVAGGWLRSGWCWEGCEARGAVIETSRVTVHERGKSCPHPWLKAGGRESCRQRQDKGPAVTR